MCWISCYCVWLEYGRTAFPASVGFSRNVGGDSFHLGIQPTTLIEPRLIWLFSFPNVKRDQTWVPLKSKWLMEYKCDVQFSFSKALLLTSLVLLYRLCNAHSRHLIYHPPCYTRAIQISMAHYADELSWYFSDFRSCLSSTTMRRTHM